MVMHSVICCYPDMEHLVEAAAARTKRYLVVSYPRDTWWSRLGARAVNDIWYRRGLGGELLGLVGVCLVSLSFPVLKRSTKPTGVRWLSSVSTWPTTRPRLFLWRLTPASPTRWRLTLMHLRSKRLVASPCPPPCSSTPTDTVVEMASGPLTSSELEAKIASHFES